MNHADYFLATARGAKIMELTRDEAVQLLPAKTVGRLAFLHEGAPMIMPMNFTLAEEGIVIRTLAHGAAARAVDTAVAFEVDDIDDFLESGWSVVVTGTAQFLTEEQLNRLRLSDAAPNPWAAGPRTLFLLVPLTGVTGRRLITS
jgi:nitroimidazol reductase NimA-like FMN-containing flavoprotein (pyridoxamine 5'-phosphate oxidase superfamily)